MYLLSRKLQRNKVYVSSPDFKCRADGKICALMKTYDISAKFQRMCQQRWIFVLILNFWMLVKNGLQWYCIYCTVFENIPRQLLCSTRRSLLTNQKESIFRIDQTNQLWLLNVLGVFRIFNKFLYLLTLIIRRTSSVQLGLTIVYGAFSFSCPEQQAACNLLNLALFLMATLHEFFMAFRWLCLHSRIEPPNKVFLICRCPFTSESIVKSFCSNKHLKKICFIVESSRDLVAIFLFSVRFFVEKLSKLFGFFTNSAKDTSNCEHNFSKYESKAFLPKSCPAVQKTPISSHHIVHNSRSERSERHGKSGRAEEAVRSGTSDQQQSVGECSQHCGRQLFCSMENLSHPGRPTRGTYVQCKNTFRKIHFLKKLKWISSKHTQLVTGKHL